MTENGKSNGNGVCMMKNTWKEEQHILFLNFISSFLRANSFRMNIVPIAPDFIFNCSGLSVAFVFLTKWEKDHLFDLYKRVKSLRDQFANFYVIMTLSTNEQNDSFVDSYFFDYSGHNSDEDVQRAITFVIDNNGKPPTTPADHKFRYEMEFGKPPFVQVQDIEMGFEKMVKIALARGECKRQDAIRKLKAERECAVQGIDYFLQVVTSIPGIHTDDANALYHAIGSIEAIARSSKEHILQTTHLSELKAQTIFSFFRDPKFYLGPNIS